MLNKVEQVIHSRLTDGFTGRDWVMLAQAALDQCDLDQAAKVYFDLGRVIEDLPAPGEKGAALADTPVIKEGVYAGKTWAEVYADREDYRRIVGE